MQDQMVGHKTGKGGDNMLEVYALQREMTGHAVTRRWIYHAGRSGPLGVSLDKRGDRHRESPPCCNPGTPPSFRPTRVPLKNPMPRTLAPPVDSGPIHTATPLLRWTSRPRCQPSPFSARYSSSNTTLPSPVSHTSGLLSSLWCHSPAAHVPLCSSLHTFCMLTPNTAEEAGGKAQPAGEENEEAEGKKARTRKRPARLGILEGADKGEAGGLEAGMRVYGPFKKDGVWSYYEGVVEEVQEHNNGVKLAYVEWDDQDEDDDKRELYALENLRVCALGDRGEYHETEVPPEVARR